jgi:hypothetical protein
MPEMMIGMNNKLYSFKQGNLYLHNESQNMNNFYGVGNTSNVKTVINDSPAENKLFKTIAIDGQGDDSWDVSLATDLQDSGTVFRDWFEKKEATWYAFIRNSGNVPALPSEYALRSVNGIGQCSAISGSGAATAFTFPISPNLVEIGSIVSAGDYVYYALGPNYDTPVYLGTVVSINVNYRIGINNLVVNALGQPIPPVGAYIMYIKSSIAESHGVLGHYCKVDITNSSTDKAELFIVSSEVMKSYP